MKYAGWIFVVLVLVGAGLTLFLANDNGTPAVTERQEMRMDPVQKAAPAERGPSGLPDHNAAQPAREAPAVTQEQRAVAHQQEERILDMARDYETVRDDPQKRQALREEMAQALALYSEAVLPIAMEKMESAQTSN
jgi:hypothetical protein